VPHVWVQPRQCHPWYLVQRLGVTCGGQWGFTLLLEVTSGTFDVPGAVLVDTETGEGAVVANSWQMERVLSRSVTS